MAKNIGRGRRTGSISGYTQERYTPTSLWTTPNTPSGRWSSAPGNAYGDYGPGGRRRRFRRWLRRWMLPW